MSARVRGRDPLGPGAGPHGRWRGDAEVAFINPVPDAPLPSAEFLRRCLDTLAARGYRRVVTGALSPLEQAGFLAAGFDVEERLHLLGIDLAGRGVAGTAGLSRCAGSGVGRQREVLAVDQAAFPVFWQFDAAGSGRRLARHADRALSGPRSAPGSHRRLCHLWPVGRPRVRATPGGGARLPALRYRSAAAAGWPGWMRRRGVARAVVNTQVGNDAALALYLQIGFEEEPIGLVRAVGRLAVIGCGVRSRSWMICQVALARCSVLIAGGARSGWSRAAGGGGDSPGCRPASSPLGASGANPAGDQSADHAQGSSAAPTASPCWGNRHGLAIARTSTCAYRSTAIDPADEQLDLVVYNRLTTRTGFDEAMSGQIARVRGVHVEPWPVSTLPAGPRRRRRHRHSRQRIRDQPDPDLLRRRR